MMKKMAEKAEEFQKKADELSRAEDEKKKRRTVTKIRERGNSPQNRKRVDRSRFIDWA